MKAFAFTSNVKRPFRQRRDEVEILFLQFFLLRAFDHPAISDEDNVFRVESIRDLTNLAVHCFGVIRVTLENLDGNGTSFRVAQQPDDDLHLPFFLSRLYPKAASSF